MSQDIHWKNYEGRFRTFPTRIEEEISVAPGLIICIPALAEPDVISTLQSLAACTLPNQAVEIIILFNKNKSMTGEDLMIHEASILSVDAWIKENQSLPFQIFPLHIEEFPDNKGGVGWARKYAMDEAARRLQQNGVIVCLDADCTVAENYLVEIEQAFLRNPEMDAASVYFEHIIPKLNADEVSITEYELHLRYLVHAQRWSGHPFAFYTVGSSMALRRRGYLAQGGMNTRSAGEDFYLLQKFIETNSFFEITSTTVFPSSRISHRVPFGTGRAMQYMSGGQDLHWMTTNFEIFKEIRPLFTALELFWKKINDSDPELILADAGIICSLSERVLSFLKATHFPEAIREITRHTSGYPSFRKRFYRYFNAFHMIRYMHYMRDHFYPDVEVQMATTDLFESMNLTPCGTARESLEVLRRLDKGF